MIFIDDIHHVTASDMMQELAGQLLFLAVCVWAAYKILRTPKEEEEEEEDEDIHLGI